MVDRLTRIARRLFPLLCVLTLAAIAIVLLFCILKAADNYGNAQSAANARAFRAAVPRDQKSDFVRAARIDLAFALAYGLLALALMTIINRWDGNRRRVGLIGCGLVIVAAVLDEVENVLLLRNLAHYDGVSDGAIDAMRTIGSVKWSAAIVGVVLVVAVLLSRALWRSTTRRHLRWWALQAWLPSGVFVTLVIGFVVVAAFEKRWLYWLLVPALAVCGSWLNEKVWSTRRTHDRLGTIDLGPPRLLFAIVQLAIGSALVAAGAPDIGNLGDGAIFLGIALVVMSLGALVSELRQNERGRPWRALVLFVPALGMLAAAVLCDVGGRALVALIVGALVLGELATEMASEDCQQWARSRRWLAIIGGAVVLVAAVSLVVLGADPLYAVLLVAGFAVFVWMASVDGDALVIVLLLAIALVVSTVPHERDVPDRLKATAGEPYVLVLGDSYMSGEGAKEFLPGTNEVVRSHSDQDPHTNECRQAPTAWPFRLAQHVAKEPFVKADAKPEFPTRVLFLACSGAVTENIDTELRLDANGHQHGPAELALYKSREPELDPPAVVIVGIGGNDAGFGDLVSACVAPGNCAEVAEQFFRNRPERLKNPPPEGQSEALSDITDDLGNAYARIHAAVGDDVPVVATAYPLPVTTDGGCAGALLEKEERLFINEFAGRLDATIREAANKAGVYFMDIRRALADEGVQLCGPISGLNFFAFGSKGGALRDNLSPKNWAHNSMHPNASGHDALQAAAYKWFSSNWPLSAVPPPAEPHGAESVDDVVARLGVEQCDAATKASCSIERGVWTAEKAKELYQQSVVPLAVTAIALWLVFLPFLAIGRGRFTLLDVLRRVFRAPSKVVARWWYSI